MADSRIQLEIEDWIRMQWLPVKFGQRFEMRHFRLKTGGFFDFDAVSVDEKIVANISTGGAFTARNKLGSGKMNKLRSDMLFLLMAEAETRLIVLTEEDMYRRWQNEKVNGRTPPEIQFVLVDLPEELRQKLLRAKKIASDEVTPADRLDAEADE